jgi:multicomponent Na+:H+ antiporter subunit F
MFAVAAVGILVSMGLALVRALLGPTVYDRVLAVNTFGTKTVLLILVIGYVTGRPDWVDLSLVYAIINFTGTIAVLKFFQYGDLGYMRRRAESESR